MPSTSGSNLYEYAVVRYLPDAERGEFVNIGLVMMCKRRRWIRMATLLPEKRLAALSGCCHTSDEINTQLEGLRRVADSRLSAGPFAGFPVEERFRWITASKSACIRTSRPHPGVTDDLDATFDRLFATLVL